EFFVEARYPYQVWELEVPLAAPQFADGADVAAMVDAFHDVHDRVFAVKEPGQYVECLYWKGRATATLTKPGVQELAAAEGEGQPDRRRRVWLDGEIDAPVYLGDSLAAGQHVGGPAIVEEPTTTVVVYPGWSLTVTATGDYLLERDSAVSGNGSGP